MAFTLYPGFYPLTGKPLFEQKQRNITIALLPFLKKQDRNYSLPGKLQRRYCITRSYQLFVM